MGVCVPCVGLGVKSLECLGRMSDPNADLRYQPRPHPAIYSMELK